ncbi:MAG: 4a-hydroxytetrahydrobiopterin dehydratase [Bdellovibrionales bacterium]|nr:4a-hydroxytetrahydrobiopterin dehydratase [Bdellovibrionales bacterium]
MAPKLLSAGEINAQLDGLPGWHLEDNKLAREFKFSDFLEAFSFMTELALLSERLNHHPEWSNVYNTVKIHLMTHDAGGVSEKDIDWAIQCNQRYNQHL